MAVLEETRISLMEAAVYFNRDVQTLRRWVKNGLCGVKLESAFIGGRVVTSREALNRFVVATNAARGN